MYSARGHSGGKLLQTDLGGQSRRFTFGRHAEFCRQQATQRLILLQRTGTVATSGQGQHDLAVRVLPIGIQLDEPPGSTFHKIACPLPDMVFDQILQPDECFLTVVLAPHRSPLLERHAIAEMEARQQIAVV